MFNKILKQLAYLDIEVLAYTMETEKCKTLARLADKLMERYTEEDVSRIFNDILFAFETRNW